MTTAGENMQVGMGTMSSDGSFKSLRMEVSYD